MEIHYNFVSLLDFLALVQGITLGVILIFQNHKKRPTLFLGLFLISYTSDLIRSILADTGVLSQHIELRFLPVNAYFFPLPFLYLYTKNLVGQLNLRKQFWTLILGVIEFFAFLSLFLLPVSQKMTVMQHPKINTFYSNYQLFSLAYSIIFIGLIIRLINRHQKDVLDYYSNIGRRHLKWIGMVAITILVYYLLSIWMIFATRVNTSSTIYQFFGIFNVIFVYWVAISGLRTPKVLVLKQASNTEYIETNQERTLYTDDHVIFMKLKELVLKEKLYKNQELNLQGLANTFGCSKRTLSRLINKEAKTNFNTFINQFRIDEAKKILPNPTYEYLNMTGIAEEVGFNSKATFFSVFKKYTGQSPGQYKKTKKS